MFDPELWHSQRRAWILARLAEIQPASVLDLGCGAGRLLATLARPPRTLAPPHPSISPPPSSALPPPSSVLPASVPLLAPDSAPRLLTGLDVSRPKLDQAHARLGAVLASDDPHQPRFAPIDVRLLEGNLAQHDPGLEGYDAVVATEVYVRHFSSAPFCRRALTWPSRAAPRRIEHLSEPVAQAFAPEVLGRLRPTVALLTTPNYAFHVHLDQEPVGKDQVDEPDAGAPLRTDPTGKTARKFRHADHQFEWTPGEFRRWAVRAARAHGYFAEIGGIGGPMDLRADNVPLGETGDIPAWDGGGAEGSSQGWRLPPPRDAPDAPPSPRGSWSTGSQSPLLFPIDEPNTDPDQEALDVSYATHVAVFWRIPPREHSASRSRSSGTGSSSRGRGRGRGGSVSSPSTPSVPVHAGKNLTPSFPPGTIASPVDEERGRKLGPTRPLPEASAPAANEESPDAQAHELPEDDDEDADDGRQVRSRQPARLTFLNDLVHSRPPSNKSTVHDVVAELHADPAISTPPDYAEVRTLSQNKVGSLMPPRIPLSTLWSDVEVRRACRGRADHLLLALGLPLPPPTARPRGYVQAHKAACRRSALPAPISHPSTGNKASDRGILATNADRTWSLSVLGEPASAGQVWLMYTPPSAP